MFMTTIVFSQNEFVLCPAIRLLQDGSSTVPKECTKQNKDTSSFIIFTNMIEVNIWKGRAQALCGQQLILMSFLQ